MWQEYEGLWLRILEKDAMRGTTGEVAINDVIMGMCDKDMGGFGWGF